MLNAIKKSSLEKRYSTGCDDCGLEGERNMKKDTMFANPFFNFHDNWIIQNDVGHQKS